MELAPHPQAQNSAANSVKQAESEPSWPVVNADV